MISCLTCGNSHKRKYEVSVIVLTYEQSKEKILLTLASIVDQRNVDLQIVISDDGSSVVYTQECIEYFEKNGFYDYKILLHNSNQGTVKNYYDALSIADGEYIKDFGPGDCFSNADSLYLWISDIKSKKGQLSFCDSVYYCVNDTGYECVSEVAHPQKPEVYLKGKSLKKKYYLLYNDIFLGAALLIRKELLQRYMKLMIDKIKYAEDNIYRLMMLDGVKCVYFPRYAIYYEWGSGISTQGNLEFRKMLDADWNATSQYIYKHCKNNFIENKIKSYYQQKEIKLSFMGKLYAYLAYWDLKCYQRQNDKNKRLTMEMDLAYLNTMRKKVMGYE